MGSTIRVHINPVFPPGLTPDANNKDFWRTADLDQTLEKKTDPAGLPLRVSGVFRENENPHDNVIETFIMRTKPPLLIFGESFNFIYFDQDTQRFVAQKSN